MKWGGAVASVLLIVAWIGSGKFGVAYNWSNGDSSSLWRGRLHIWQSGKSVPAGRTGFEPRGTTDFGLDWWMSSFKRYNRPQVSIPLWWLVLPSVAASAAVWRHDAIKTRRELLNHCEKCGYDRTGILQDAKCPECGAVP